MDQFINSILIGDFAASVACAILLPRMFGIIKPFWKVWLYWPAYVVVIVKYKQIGVDAINGNDKF